MKKIIIFLLLICLALVSCQDEKTKTDVDRDKEIAEKYTNKVASYDAFIEFYKGYPVDESGKKESPTYYELVKALDSTGVNTSDSTYRYEWKLDNGMYLHAYFIFTEYKGGEVPAECRANDYIYIHRFSLDPDVISEQYSDYSHYLYDVYYKTRCNSYTSYDVSDLAFSSYDDFFAWFGFKEVPSADGLEIRSDDKTESIIENGTYVPVDKVAALNLKDGMTYRETVKLLGSAGQFWGTKTVRWKVDDDFFVMAKYSENPDYNPDTVLHLIKYENAAYFYPPSMDHDETSASYNSYYYGNAYLMVFRWYYYDEIAK